MFLKLEKSLPLPLNWFVKFNLKQLFSNQQIIFEIRFIKLKDNL